MQQYFHLWMSIIKFIEICSILCWLCIDNHVQKHYVRNNRTMRSHIMIRNKILRCFIAARNLDVTPYTTKRQYAVKNCNVDYLSDNLSLGPLQCHRYFRHIFQLHYIFVSIFQYSIIAVGQKLYWQITKTTSFLFHNTIYFYLFYQLVVIIYPIWYEINLINWFTFMIPCCTK